MRPTAPENFDGDAILQTDLTPLGRPKSTQIDLLDPTRRSTVDTACSNRLPSLKFVCDTLSFSALISLVILTFHLLTSKLVHVIAGGVDNHPTYLVFLGLFVLDIWANNCQTDFATSTFNVEDYGACR